MGYRTIHRTNEQARARRELLDRRLHALIRPLPAPVWTAHFHWANLETELLELGRNYGGLDLRAPGPRRAAWTLEQQTRFIENVLREVVAPGSVAVRLNCPHWNDSDYAGDLPYGIQVVDGLQRLAAIRRFMHGELMPFGLSASGFAGSSYATTRICPRYQLTVVMHAFQSRGELLECVRHFHPARDAAPALFARSEDDCAEFARAG